MAAMVLLIVVTVLAALVALVAREILADGYGKVAPPQSHHDWTDGVRIR